MESDYFSNEYNFSNICIQLLHNPIIYYERTTELSNDDSGGIIEFQINP